MPCESCEGRGFVDCYYGAGATFTPSVKQCPRGCNLRGYSEEVQRRLNDDKRVTSHLVLKALPPDAFDTKCGGPGYRCQVIPFRRKDGD